MSSIDIKININKLKDYSASLDKSPKKKTLLLIIESFAEYIKTLYGCLIEESINSRRYRGEWEPLDEKEYLEYIGVTPKTDILYLIKDALECKKIGTNFYVRFNPRYKYPGTSIPLVRVLAAIEYGTSKFNARPILRKNVRLIESNMMSLWRGFLTKKGII